MSTNQLIIFMTCNSKYTYITHNISTTVHCAYVVHLGKTTPFNKYQKTCPKLCVKVITNFCRWVPNCHPCSSSLQTDNKTLLRTGFLCNFVLDNMEPDFVDPFYHPDLSEQNKKHIYSTVQTMYTTPYCSHTQ